VIKDHLLDGELKYNRVWSCTLCELCKTRCPADVDYPDFVRGLRKNLIEGDQSDIPDLLKKINLSVSNTGNIYGTPAEDRTLWIDISAEKVNVNKKAKVAYFVGCAASTLPRLEGVVNSFVRLMNLMNTDYTVLGADEWCCGNPLAICEGRETEAIYDYAKRNVLKLNTLSVETLVTTCPGCFRIFKFHYPEIQDYEMNFEVLHASQFLAQKIDDGDLVIQRPTTSMKNVTYHDPCELGRIGGIYEEPRKIMEYVAGESFVEVDLNKDQTKCCGAGGLFKATNPEIALQVGNMKLKEFQDVGAETVVTGCPACEINFANAIFEKKSPLKVIDIVEFVDSAMNR
jgi:Fe-S oxidoreductase